MLLLKKKNGMAFHSDIYLSALLFLPSTHDPFISVEWDGLFLLPREEGGGGVVLLSLVAQLVRMIQETRSCFVLVVCNDDDI